MSRYIDADAMKEWLDEYLSVFKKYDKSEVKGFVEHQPSIDIVRCQDCRYRYMDADLQVWTCTYGLMIKPDGFCNYGERKESE